MCRGTALRLMIVCLGHVLATATPPARSQEPAVPAPLEPWKTWVLHDVKHFGSPSPYDDATTRLPVWPSSLALDLDAAGGRWKLNVRAFGRTWLPLPGNAETWPQDVLLDDKPGAVVIHDSVPSIVLQEGEHRVSGSFVWSRQPERLAVPATVGIVTLSLGGVSIAMPERDADGWLWLERSRAVEEERNQLGVKVARVLEDGLPIWLRTEIELSVSGRSREELIGQILPAGWQLAAVEGSIPVAVDDAGQLRAQVRPGTWRIQIDAFRTEDISHLAYGEGAQPATDEELVAVRLRPEFRVIELVDALPVDVAMTTFPDRWRKLPVFRWQTDHPLEWVVKDSGTGLRQPDRFEIHRRLWLDDDGHGMTFEDTIHGECRELSRLDAADGHELAVVRIDGERQLITADPVSATVGVELRSPRPVIQAIGRMQREARLQATGWRTAADSLRLSLALPPGWRMLAMFGADRVEGDWLTAWTLLDLFLLLIFSLAVFRMRGLVAGLVAFFAFGLAYHEPSAPRFTWLFLLMPLALLGVVRSDVAARWLRAWKLLAVGLLLVHLIPFVTAEIQSALYPQLEPAGIHYRQRRLWEVFRGPRPNVPAGQVQREDQVEADGADFSRSSVPRELEAMLQQQSGKGSKARRDRLQTANMQFAPGTNTQTGIPRPAWEGNLVECVWDGPVSAEQAIRPILLPAVGHRLLAVVRVVLLGLLVVILLRVSWQQTPTAGSTKAVRGAAVLMLGLTSWPAAVRANEAQGATQDGIRQQRLLAELAEDGLLSAPLLEQLRERLLEPADAFPHAAEIPRARLEIIGNRLTLSATVHAAVACAVPVPGRFPAWSPLKVSLDGEPAAAIVRRSDGYLWVRVPAGVTKLAVEGVLPEAPEWIWGFQLVPRQLEVEAADWIVTGLGEDGRPDGQLFLTRRQQGVGSEAGYDQTNLRGVVQIDRVLEVGLVWRVQTTVRRLSRPGRAITLKVPLLPGERVLSGGATGDAGMVDVTLASNADAYSWESELPITREIRLEARSSPQSVERWSLMTSPVWNVRPAGLGPVYEATSNDLIPVWYPWPGEAVTLSISRPQAIDGKTLTIQSIDRTTDLGTRRRNSSIDMRIESSLGGEFFVGLPDEATVRQLELNGRSLPVRREAGRVLVGLQPGIQRLTLAWTTDEPLAHRSTFETVRLPVEAANVTSRMQLPKSRWILWAHGSLRGPAVRFWAVLALAAVLAAVLCRPQLSPLRFHEWLLLIVGLTQVSLPASVAVVGWLYLLSWRGRQDPQAFGWFSFNLLQLVLVFLTLTSLLILVFAVSRGLLGQPEMFIAGNGSYKNRLIWFTPQEGQSLGQPWVFSISIWYYRLLMLLWGLWLANAVIRWLMTGWRQFTTGSGWRHRKRLARESG